MSGETPGGLGDGLAERVETVRFDFLNCALGDYERALVIRAAVDCNNDIAGGTRCYIVLTALTCEVCLRVLGSLSNPSLLL